MKKIERKKYLQELISSKDIPTIKVITGIRRSGKSEILKDYISYLANEDVDSNIVYINFQDLDFDDLKDYHRLNKYIVDKYKLDKRNYLFIDEIQMCPNFELVINSIHSKEMYDIYITGSNAFLLSSDLATLFTGRTTKIEMYPFSFQEYLLYSGLDIESGFEKYVKYGGMPGSYVFVDEKQRVNYLNDVFDTIILKDIVVRNKVQDSTMLFNISDFLMDNISNLTTPNKVSDILAANKYQASHNTVNNYITYLCEAFVFYKAKRYDLKGKKHLATSEKYYLSDHSFRFSKLGTRSLDLGRIYENIVYLELLRRGYSVYVGKLYDKEIDFVAMKNEEKIYIQVSSFIDNPETFEREYKPLLSIKDAYQKIIIARTHQDEYSFEGIKVFDIAIWLSK